MPLEQLMKDHPESITHLVTSLGRCSAGYRLLAEISEAEDDATAAKNARGSARGARVAAMYLLGQEHVLTNREPAAYGEFAPYVDALVDAGSYELKGMLEEQNYAAIREELTRCQSLAEIQTTLVRIMSDELAAARREGADRG